MNNKRVLTYICLTLFLVGLFSGVVLGYYVLPKLSNISNSLNNQSVYTVENKCEPIEEEVGDECSISVDIEGSVKHPGVYCLEGGSLVVDALNISGGLIKGYAKEYISRKINLALPLRNNQKIYFPFEKDTDCKIQEFSVVAQDIEDNFNDANSSTGTNDSSSTEGSDSGTQCVNINTALKDELITLNGVGDSTAQKIIAGRPYTKIEDLLNVSGIGVATLNKFKDKICI